MAAQAYSMEGAIAGWFSFMAFSNFSGVECTSSVVRKISVEPHHNITRREQLCFFLKFAMSFLICSAISYLFFPFFTFLPSSILTYSRSKAAGIGLILERNFLTIAR